MRISFPRQEEFPMQTQLNMNHNSITNLKDPEFGGEAATKTYVDATSSTIVSSTAASIATKLDLSGGKMTGDLDMGTKKIRNFRSSHIFCRCCFCKFCSKYPNKLPSLQWWNNEWPN